jgi:hypothetical protein
MLNRKELHKLPSDCVRGLTNSPMHSPTAVRKNKVVYQPNKMVVTPFTRKRNIKGLKEPILFGNSVTTTVTMQLNLMYIFLFPSQHVSASVVHLQVLAPRQNCYTVLNDYYLATL